ncbi:MAG: histidine phosphatase family protein [Betaproteobacteria bacterium]|nr:histidine phosphatase family protein [Betaproteobacteria bacterium]
MHCTRILAIRHGETAWNRDNRIQGQLDIELNMTGRWQAERTAEALRGEALGAVYSSDLSRAADTAAAIARAQGLSTQLHAGLRERHFGVCQGSRWSELETTQPELTALWRRRVPDFAPPGGESLLMLRQRVLQALEDVAVAHLGQQIVVVTHGGVLDTLYRLATGVDLQAPRTWQLGNAAINRLLWSPQGLRLVGWSDTLHLDTAPSDEPLS